MGQTQRILLQTTIPFAADDWHVGRFSLLAQTLREHGHAVTARDRETGPGTDDPLLATLSREAFDQVWIIGVDSGDGITAAECAAVSAFRDAGGAVFVTRDHMDLGSSVCSLGGVGEAHYFHTKHPPSEGECVRDDMETPSISWPNFHSGSNGDVQRIEVCDPVHPVLLRRDGTTLETLPAHPHEGYVSAPPGDRSARVVCTGTSSATGRRFNIAVAFDGGDGAGRGWAQSTFHHFVDYNWDLSKGCPSFLTEPPGSQIERDPALLEDTRRFVANLATWLGSGLGE